MPVRDLTPDEVADGLAQERMLLVDVREPKETVLERVSAALESGESVKISGFGTFSVRQKGRRIGRNPKTGKEVPILPRRVLVFRPSQLLRARVNGLCGAQSTHGPEEE